MWLSEWNEEEEFDEALIVMKNIADRDPGNDNAAWLSTKILELLEDGGRSDGWFL